MNEKILRKALIKEFRFYKKLGIPINNKIFRHIKSLDLKSYIINEVEFFSVVNEIGEKYI